MLNSGLEKKYQRLFDEAIYLPPVCDTYDPSKPPKWYDKNKLARSQQICMKYFYSLFTSILIGTFLTFQTPTFVDPVITTGNHGSVTKIYRRYLATAIHMLKWFLEDPFDGNSSAYRSFSQVRSMHMKLCISMNDSMNRKVGVDKLHSSLHDVTMAMFPFIGLLMNYPVACGAHGMTSEEKDGIIYTWRVISYALGIDDRYNVCDGPADDFSKLYKHFEVTFLVPQLSDVPNTTPLGWRLSQGYIFALQKINASLNFNSLIYYWFKNIGVPIKIKLSPLEWIIMTINHLVTHYLLRFRFIYNLVNNHVRSKIDHHKRIRNQVARDLDRRFSHITYESLCPMNKDPDYRDDLAD